jgi:hypothetical protein
MITRNVTIKLKANAASEFTPLMENEIIPFLRKQKGFCGAVSFIAPERLEAVAVSLWETAENAKDYDQVKYPEVLSILSHVVEGSPKVETFELANSTFHKIAAKSA